MPKVYMDQFDDNLDFTVLMHPSTWLFAWLTKNVTACSTVTGLVVGVISLSNAVLGGPFITMWLLGMSFVWFVYFISVIIRSRRIRKDTYNKYLYPIEVAFNSMSHSDQKKYTNMLTNAYAICARRNLDEYVELEKIRELFELTAPEDKVSSLDSELEKKRRALEIKQAHDRMLQEIVEDLNSGVVDGH